MATSKPNSSESTDRILVRGIPSSVNADKLIIHFQRHRNGGGDVRAVTFPLTKKEPDTAIVIFESSTTVPSVLSQTQKIAGKVLTVTALEPEPRIFDIVVAQISRFVLEKIESKAEDIDDVFEDVKDVTGCIIEKKKDVFEVKGEWYQVQAAFDKLEAMVSDNVQREPPVTPLPTRDNGYLSSSSPTPAQPIQSPAPAPQPARKVVSTIIDKDTYAYMEKVHKTDLQRIKDRCMIDYKATQIGGDATKIEVVPITSTSDAERAVKELEGLNQTIQNDEGQEVVDIDPNISASTLNDIFGTLLPEFPEVHMGRIDASPNQIIIIAPSNEKCRMAADMLKHYTASASTSPSTPPSTAASSGENQIDVDKDVLEFLMKVNGPTLERIWDTCGAKIKVSTIGDCSKLEVVSKGSKMAFRPQEAINQFQRIYTRANDEACQETYDLGKLKNPVSTERLSDAIRMTSTVHKEVHISQMFEDKDQVLFIAKEKAQCGAAMKLFEQLVGGSKQPTTS